MSQTISARVAHPRARSGRGVTIAVALLLAVGSVVGLGQAARADTPGITASMLYNGKPLASDQVLHAGDSLDLKAQYDNTKVVPGSTVDFVVGASVSVASLPAANTSIASVKQTSNGDGTTTLEGETFYSMKLRPVRYFGAWGRLLLHQIHLRVLRHVAALSEDPHHAERAPCLLPSWMTTSHGTCRCTRRGVVE